jgi:hypothetical protein
MFLALVLLVPLGIRAQELGSENTSALTLSRSVSIPLNAVQLHDNAMEAWTWTFGKEPGAVLKRSDREQGVIEGVARLPFRSQMLTGREESMGTIQYRVSIQVRAGECRTVVSELSHTGNRTTPKGGIHVGQLTRGEMPARRVGGLGGNNTARLHAELKEAATARITAVMQAFESRLRASVED